MFKTIVLLFLLVVNAPVVFAYCSALDPVAFNACIQRENQHNQMMQMQQQQMLQQKIYQDQMLQQQKEYQRKMENLQRISVDVGGSVHSSNNKNILNEFVGVCHIDYSIYMGKYALGEMPYMSLEQFKKTFKCVEIE